MRYSACSVLLLISIHFSSGQGIARSKQETAVQFVNRFMPKHSTLAGTVLETQWNDTPVIIAFFTQGYRLPKEADPEQQPYVRLVGSIFFNTGGNHYNRLVIDTIDSEGGEPAINDVFFANADKGNNKELIVLVSWPQVHKDVQGTLYATYVYDRGNSAAQKLRYLKSISEKLSGGCDCVYEDGRHSKATFTTAAAVIAALQRSGYKQ